MKINEAFSLMGDIRKAEANPKTPVGAAKSLQKHLGKTGRALIGPCLPDGRFALYAQSPNGVPEEWNGYPVVDTAKRNLKKVLA